MTKAGRRDPCDGNVLCLDWMVVIRICTCNKIACYSFQPHGDLQLPHFFLNRFFERIITMYSHKCHAREPCEHRMETCHPSGIREKQSKEASHGRGSHRCESARMKGGAWERKRSVSGL